MTQDSDQANMGQMGADMIQTISNFCSSFTKDLKEESERREREQKTKTREAKESKESKDVKDSKEAKDDKKEEKTDRSRKPPGAATIFIVNQHLRAMIAQIWPNLQTHYSSVVPEFFAELTKRRIAFEMALTRPSTESEFSSDGKSAVIGSSASASSSDSSSSSSSSAVASAASATYERDPLNPCFTIKFMEWLDDPSFKAKIEAKDKTVFQDKPELVECFIPHIVNSFEGPALTRFWVFVSNIVQATQWVSEDQQATLDSLTKIAMEIIKKINKQKGKIKTLADLKGIFKSIFKTLESDPIVRNQLRDLFLNAEDTNVIDSLLGFFNKLDPSKGTSKESKAAREVLSKLQDDLKRAESEAKADAKS